MIYDYYFDAPPEVDLMEHERLAPTRSLEQVCRLLRCETYGMYAKDNDLFWKNTTFSLRLIPGSEETPVKSITAAINNLAPKRVDQITRILITTLDLDANRVLLELTPSPMPSHRLHIKPYFDEHGTLQMKMDWFDMRRNDIAWDISASTKPDTMRIHTIKFLLAMKRVRQGNGIYQSPASRLNLLQGIYAQGGDSMHDLTDAVNSGSMLGHNGNTTGSVEGRKKLRDLKTIFRVCLRGASC